MSPKVIKRLLLWGLLFFSVASLFLAPTGELIADIVRALPWIGGGLLVSEVLFVGGLGLVAMSMGLKIQNPLRLHHELKAILGASTTTRLFWVGFWMNAVGACASSIIAALGIFMVLPMTSWGLIVIPLMDLVATIAIRQWAIRSCERERDLS